MNLSTVVTRIKLKLGLLAIATPIENLDETIVTILQDITRPVFSLYAPFREKIVLKTCDLELMEKTAEYEKYLLPDFKTKKLIYVIDVTYDSSMLSGLGSYGAMPMLQGDMLTQLLMSNAAKNVGNLFVPKITFHYEHPRTLYLYNMYSSSKIVIELGFEHDKSLASIPESASESFMDLALLDVKENLYPTVKQYTDIQTAIGNINFKLDSWENAESERKELLSRWDDLYHLDQKVLYYT